MAQNDPSSDDKKPANADDIIDNDVTDAVERLAEQDDAIDAEIVDDRPADEDRAAAAASHADEEGDHAAAPANDESGRGLAAPFAIIIGALVVVAALVIFLNRDNDAQTTGGTDTRRPDTAATAPAVSYPIGSTPTPAVDAPLPTTSTDESTSSADDAENANATVAADAAPTVGDDAGEVATNALLARAEAMAADNVTADDSDTPYLDVADEPSSAAATIAEMTAGDAADAANDGPSAEEVTTIIGAADVAEEQPEPGTPATPDVTTADSSTAGPVVDTTPAPTSGPAVIAGAPAAITSAVPPEEVIAARIDDIKSTVKQDVLAETEEAINQAIGKTERDVADLRSKVSEQTELQRETNERLAELSSRLETIQTSELTTTRTSTLLLALADLSDAIESGAPFSRQLDTVDSIAPNMRELVALRRYADDGLMTDTTLRQSYQEAARNALSGVKRAEADTAMERFMANMSGLFTVRKIGDVEGDSLSAIIARAEVRLENGDLSSALRELGALNDTAKAAFADWVNAAEAKVDARRRIEAIEKQVAASRAG